MMLTFQLEMGGSLDNLNFIILGAVVWTTDKHETLSQRWPNIGPPSSMLTRHWVNVLCMPGIILVILRCSEVMRMEPGCSDNNASPSILKTMDQCSFMVGSAPETVGQH